jgi:uncharacterized repeat protein (TIGR01451 family)
MFRTWWHGVARHWSPSPRGRKRSAWRRRLPLSFEQLEERILLSSLVVNNPGDVAVVGQTSLRQAIATANADAVAGTSDTIVFDPSLGSGTITLTQGVLELSGAGAGTITIDGSGPNGPLTVSGNKASTIFQIDKGVQAVLAHLDLTDGQSSSNGGAIFNAGTLTVSNATISGSSAAYAGAIENKGTLTVTGSTFSGNKATTGGGAIDSNAGSLTVSGSFFTDNTVNAGVPGGGGAVRIVGGTAAVSTTTFSGNTAGDGGAIENQAGTLTLGKVTLVGNTVSHQGGGLDNESGTVTVNDATFSGNTANYAGGGLENGTATSTVTLTNVTVTGNTGGSYGGGLEDDHGTLTLLNTTVSGNHAGFQAGGITNDGATLVLQNSIVAGNTAGSLDPDTNLINTDNGNNLLGTGDNNSGKDPHPGPGDVFNDNPLLAPLGFYGGPTQTLPPLASSLAVGAGNAGATLPATDQRGLPRIVGGSLDIGAVQTQPPALAFGGLGQTVTAGLPATITVQLLDLDGVPGPAGSGGVSLALASSSTTGTFLDGNGNSLTGSSITVPAGESSATFEYVDRQPGTPTLTVTAAGLGSISQQETILPARISVTPTTDIVVGRTLSAYFTGDVQNNQETITYTVYNEQADRLTGVLLTDTLASGVTFVSASQLPDQSGQNLAWSLGTIRGFDRASVTLTVSLAGSTPLQLDSGAEAFATLDAGPVSNATAAAKLRQGSVDPNLLASTPDANTTDPYVQEEAAKLDYNAQNIFNFLHDDVGYNSYTGSLRGARGTLWSSAGNSLDVASLGVALMRASGIPAQYASGTLSKSQAQPLVLSMFPASYQTVGYIPAGTQTADPTNDPQLLSETESHSWFQFEAGQGMQDADPLVAGAQVGQSFTAATGTFPSVPDDLRQKTEVKLNAEFYNQASAAFGVSGFSTTTVLDQTFNDVDLVGHPLSVGQFVSTSFLPSPVFVSKTTTYAPYLAVGDEAFASSHSEVITGQPYQETLTNFPLGNQVLTGLFLDVALTGPGLAAETFERALVDRVGYATRQEGGSGSLTFDPNGPPALSDFDVFTLNVLGSRGNPAYSGPLVDEAQQTSAALAQLNPNDAAGQAAYSQWLRTLVTGLTREYGSTFFSVSDTATSQIARASLVTAYYDRPRLTLVSSQFMEGANGAPGNLSLSIDLRRDTMRVVAFPGQNGQATVVFNLSRGVAESSIEQAVLAPASPPAGQPVQSVGAAAVLTAASQQGVPLVAIGANNLATLDGLTLSMEAKARITDAVGRGLFVVVPQSAVTVNGIKTIGWYEINAQTGETVGVMENGGHQGFVQFATTYAAVAASAIGILVATASFAATTVIVCGNSKTPQALKLCLKNISFGAGVIGFLITANGVQLTLTGNYFIGLLSGAAGVTLLADSLVTAALASIDPPVAPLLSDLAPTPLIPANVLQTSQAVQPTITPGAVSGDLQTPSLAVSGNLTGSWTTATTSGFMVQSLQATSATVTDARGATIGSGTVALAATAATPVAVSGNVTSDVQGQGSLSFYSPATSKLGVSGQWQNYTATLSGSSSLQLTSGALTLNGSPLPAGSYTITTSSATLGGSGPSTTPNFLGAVTFSASNGTVEVGPATGSVRVGGKPLDAGNGLTLAGYTGTVALTAGTSSDAATLDGTAANALGVTATPATLTTNQNTPVSFSTAVQTSLADTYRITAEAPAGWLVAVDGTGRVTVTPAPGLQGGTFPIRVIARSTTNSDLVAQGEVLVTITPTQPGITLAVARDTTFTLPVGGAQVPTAFRATIHNSGPAADTFQLTFPNPPSGFQILSSTTSLAVPAGATAMVGIYLQPSGPLPAPGTQTSFPVTATSTTNAPITATQTLSFTVPTIDAVTLTATPAAVSTTPGTAVTATLTLTDVGNAPENVTLAATGTTGLTAGSLTPVSLTVGQSMTEAITLTPDASTPLNSTFQATVTATFGPSAAPVTQSVEIPVQVVAPGVATLNAAAAAAGQAGSTALSNRLSDLGIAITNLFQTPTDPVAKGQALASLDSLISQAAADTFLAPFAAGPTTARGAIAAAASAADVQAAATNLATALATFGQAITNDVAHSFTIGLQPSYAEAQPQTPAVFTITLKNTGNATTTYDLRVAGLPANVTPTFSQPSVTLNPGAQTAASGANALTLTLTETGNTLVPANFTVIATAEGAKEITNGAQGALTLRDTFLQVATVTSNPPFVAPGATGNAAHVDVSAKVQSVVNQPQADTVSYVVQDPTGKTVFTSTPVPLSLTITSGLTTLDLGTFDTTGFAQGAYTVTATVADPSGKPIPSSSGQGVVTVGLPVTASVTTTPATVPAGTATVTNTVQLNTQASPSSLFNVVAQVPISSAEGVAQNGNMLYVSSKNGIEVFDISNINSPQLLRMVGQSSPILRIHGNELVAMGEGGGPSSTFVVSIYSLVDPTNPQLLGSTPAIPYGNEQDMLVTDTHVFVPIIGVPFYLDSHQIIAQDGDVLSIDISNPAAPHLDGVLLNTHGTDNDGIDVVGGYDRSGGNFNMWSVAQANATTLLVGSTTATGTDTQDGVGLVRVLDITDPTHMTDVTDLQIPGTVEVIDLAIQGSQALVIASSGGYQNNFSGGSGSTDNYGLTGHLVLATLDITDPRNPKLLTTQPLSRDSRGSNFHGPGEVALGNGLYAFSNWGQESDPRQLFVSNANDPTSLGVGVLNVPSKIVQLAGSNTLVFTTDATGLTIYQIGSPPAVSVTVQVQVPHQNVTVVSGSFNVPPTKTTTGTNSDTLEWDLLLPGGESTSLSWQSTVTGLQAGASRSVTQGTTVNFVSQGTPGTLTLPATAVTGVPIISLTPAAQTAPPGGSATYDVRIENPTDASVTYSVFLQSTVSLPNQLPSSVTVGPQGTVDVPLTITPRTGASPGNDTFTVTAEHSVSSTNPPFNPITDAKGTVQGTLTVAGSPIQAVPNAYGAVVTLTPASASAGQGTSTTYTVQVTNTGSGNDTFDLATTGLPAGVRVTLGQSSVEVPPGASNFRDVTLTLTPQQGAVAGSDSFSVTATSKNKPSATGSASGTLNVVGNGVNVSLNPPSGAPGSSFQLTVTNTGQVMDTFDLALGGPAALVSSLGMPKVTLAPGASQVVPIATGAVTFADAGSLNLMGMAQSEANPAVQAGASASLTIPNTTGMTAQFSPAVQVLPVPGTSSFLLLVHNTGNTEDSYSATITATTGPLSASLTGLDGQPAQAIPVFRLPGLSTGAILVHTTLAQFSQGTVTVTVQSQSNPSLVTSSTATVSAAAVVVSPGTLQFSTASYSATEESGAATVTLTRTGGSTGAVSVVVSTADGSGIAGQDYVPIGQVVTWADGDTSPKTVTIPLNDDNLVEGNDTVRLALSNPGGGARVGSPGSAVLTILEDQEPAPPPKLSLTKAVEHTGLVLTLSGPGFTKGSAVVLRGHVKGRAFTLRLKTKFLGGTRVQAKVPKFVPAFLGAGLPTVEENNDLTFSVQTPGGVETASQRFTVLEEVKPGSAGTPAQQAAVVAYEALNSGHEYTLKQIPKSFLKQFFATFGSRPGG